MRAAALVLVIVLAAAAANAETLSGVVLLPGGAPAPRALVTLYRDHRFLACETAADGTFQLEFPPDVSSVTLRVRLSGYVSVKRSISHGQTTVRVALVALAGAAQDTCDGGCTLRGWVVDRRGIPVSGALVMAKALTARSPTARTETGADGTFRFVNVPADLHSIVALAPRLKIRNTIVANPRVTSPVIVQMEHGDSSLSSAFEALDSVVATGAARTTTRDVLLLATPSRRAKAWRVRAIETPTFESAALARSGSKVVLQRQGRRLAVDLSMPIRNVEFGQTEIQVGQQVDVTPEGERAVTLQLPVGLSATKLNNHHLHEMLTLQQGGDTRIVDDDGAVHDAHLCITMLGRVARAAITAAGDAFCIGVDGRRLLVSAGGSSQPAYVPPPDAVIVADGGDPTTPGIADFIGVERAATQIVLRDAVSGSILAQLDTPASARDPMRLGVLAALALQSHERPQLLAPAALLAVDDALRRAVRTAPDADTIAWTLTRTRLDARVYAPVLEFERDEPAFPARVDVWKSKLLRPSDSLPTDSSRIFPGAEADAREQYLLDLYDSTRRQDSSAFGTVSNSLADPNARCAIYYRVVDLGSTWLVQYWFYYPFDIGGTGSHLHDSEHLFVEVDKLGGMVLHVVGAAHGGLTANNIFRTELSPLPVSLPLFAIAELGKHATAPDLNRDGRFTPGLDDNVHHSTGELWGIRDTMGHTDSRLAPYAGHMAADHTERLAVKDLREIYNEANQLPLRDRCVCDLLPFPEFTDAARKGDCVDMGPFNKEVSAPGSDCAAEFLNDEPDRTDVNSVWKKWNFPSLFVRAGMHTPSSVSDGGVSGDLVFGLERPTGDILHGRIGVGAVAKGRVNQFGIQYEQFVSNFIGVMLGSEWNKRAQDATWHGRWVIGPAFEFPLPIVNRLGSAQLALGIQDGGNLSMEWRFALGVWAQQRYRFAGADR